MTLDFRGRPASTSMQLRRASAPCTSCGPCTFGSSIPASFSCMTARRSFSVWPVSTACTRANQSGAGSSGSREKNSETMKRARSRSASEHGARGSSRSMTTASAPWNRALSTCSGSLPGTKRTVRSGLLWARSSVTIPLRPGRQPRLALLVGTVAMHRLPGSRRGRGGQDRSATASRGVDQQPEGASLHRHADAKICVPGPDACSRTHHGSRVLSLACWHTSQTPHGYSGLSLPSVWSFWRTRHSSKEETGGVPRRRVWVAGREERRPLALASSPHNRQRRPSWRWAVVATVGSSKRTK